MFTKRIFYFNFLCSVQLAAISRKKLRSGEFLDPIQKLKNIFRLMSNFHNLSHYYSEIKIFTKIKDKMEQRINAYEKGYNAIKPLFGLGAYLAKSSLEKSLLELINFRVSQINGCAYCLDMHSKDMRAECETEQRLYLLSAWREVPFYTERERAALAWAEAVTTLTGGQVPDQIYEEARKQFSETELIDLTMSVIGINSYNRINVAFRTPAGTYKVGQHAALVLS